MAVNIFTSPREIYYGAGALNSVGNVLGQRVLVVTDSGVKAQGLLDKLEAIIKGQGWTWWCLIRWSRTPPGN